MVVHEQKEIIKLNSNNPLIIALPFAGGNTYSYRNILYNLDNTIDVLCPELPGRGAQSRAELIKDARQLTFLLFSQWISHLNLRRPYIIYGHSMGGLLAYLLCQHISALGLHSPKHLIISGRESPSCTHSKRKLFSLPSHMFWSEVEKLGGTAQEILQDEELKTFFEPVLRSDFEVVESYRHDEIAPLNVPLSIFYGSEESTLDKMNSWKKETTKEVMIQELLGNHFFIYNHAAKLSSYINQIAL